MTDLIKRLEEAREPSRELDEAVHIADGWIRKCRDLDYCPGYDEWWERDGEKIIGWQNIPAYTSSVDAALSLVPEGCGWVVGWGQSVPDEAMGGAIITPHARFAGYDVSNDCIADADAATPALAICIAALKAKLADPPTPRPEAGEGVE